VKFDRAYVSAPWTKPSIASMLTGLHPTTHSTQRMNSSLHDENDTLAEILSRVGYRTAGVVSNRLITGVYNFRQGFELFVKKDAKDHSHLSSPGVTKSAIELIDRLEGKPQPFFLFVHYFDPHYAYQRHEKYGFSRPGAGRLVGGEPMGDLRRLRPPPDADELQFIVDLYDEEVRFCDEAIGELLDALRARGLYDDTLIVLTADHGEEFYERSWLGHTRHLYEELIRVPLAIRLPGGAERGRVIERPVSLVALAPTILDALHFDYAQLEFGEPSLLSLMRGEGSADPRLVFSEVDYDLKRPRPVLPDRRSAYMRALVRGNDKLIHDRLTDEYELYDLAVDPLERRDLAEQRPELLHELKGELEAWVQRLESAGSRPAAQQTIDADEREMLKKLGYIDD
jgi:arylsulfatase A-like enzyme